MRKLCSIQVHTPSLGTRVWHAMTLTCLASQNYDGVNPNLFSARSDAVYFIINNPFEMNGKEVFLFAATLSIICTSSQDTI